MKIFWINSKEKYWKKYTWKDRRKCEVASRYIFNLENKPPGLSLRDLVGLHISRRLNGLKSNLYQGESNEI